MTTMSRVDGRSALRTSEGSSMPSGRGATIVSAISPRLLSPDSGRSTLLCSRKLVTTWSPRRRMPLMARFSASVQLNWKATQLPSGAQRKSESASRVRNTQCAACSAASCPDRPGFAL